MMLEPTSLHVNTQYPFPPKSAGLDLTVKSKTFYSHLRDIVTAVLFENANLREIMTAFTETEYENIITEVRTQIEAYHNSTSFSDNAMNLRVRVPVLLEGAVTIGSSSSTSASGVPKNYQVPVMFTFMSTDAGADVTLSTPGGEDYYNKFVPSYSGF